MSGLPISQPSVDPSASPGDSQDAVRQAAAIAAVYQLAGQIDQLLAGASNRITREALMVVASRHNLRVVPADRPIGMVCQPPKKEGGKKKPSGGAKAQPRKAEWKTKPEYLALSKQRKELVAQLNALKEAGVEDNSLLQRLRSTESAIKALRPLSGN